MGLPNLKALMNIKKEKDELKVAGKSGESGKSGGSRKSERFEKSEKLRKTVAETNSDPDSDSGHSCAMSINPFFLPISKPSTKLSRLELKKKKKLAV